MPLIRICLSFAPLCLLINPGVAQEPADRAADEAAIRAVVQEFIDTREDNDAQSLRALLTQDADQLVTSGAMRSGREAVVDGSLSTTRGAGGSRTIELESIRFLTADVAIADGPYDIVDRIDGPDRHYLTTMVLTRVAGTWKIAAIRNMQPLR
jgi:uncharacterized protein (TIGR02246 family)